MWKERPYCRASLSTLLKSGGPPAGTSSAISSKYLSKPGGDMISIIRVVFVPAFQKVWGTFRGLKTYVPGVAVRILSPILAPISPSITNEVSSSLVWV